MHEETASEFEPRMTCSYMQQEIWFLLDYEQVLLGSTSLSFVSSDSLDCEPILSTHMVVFILITIMQSLLVLCSI